MQYAGSATVPKHTHTHIAHVRSIDREAATAATHQNQQSGRTCGILLTASAAVCVHPENGIVMLCIVVHRVCECECVFAVMRESGCGGGGSGGGGESDQIADIDMPDAVALYPI